MIKKSCQFVKHTLYFLVSYLQTKRNKESLDVKLSNTCYLTTEEMFFHTARTTIIFHLINVAHYVTGQNCNDFTVGSCADNDNLIWENDQVESKYLGGSIITEYYSDREHRFMPRRVSLLHPL